MRFFRVQHDALTGPLESEGLLLLEDVGRLLPLLGPLLRQVPLLGLLHRQLPGRRGVVLGHHRPKFVDLFPEFSDQLHVRIFVDRRLVDDVLRSVGVTQGGQRLAVIDLRRADRGDHDGLGVAAQGVFKQPRQHGVSVRYEDRLDRGCGAGHVVDGGSLGQR